MAQGLTLLVAGVLKTGATLLVEVKSKPELADNDAWQLLIALTEKMGMSDMARDFQNALREEDEHLAYIRQWFKEMVMEDAAVAS